MSKLQLMAGGQLSQTLGLKSVALDWKEEVARLMEEQKYEAGLTLPGGSGDMVCFGPTRAARPAATYFKPKP